jgi:hypothetical protein
VARQERGDALAKRGKLVLMAPATSTGGGPGAVGKRSLRAIEIALNRRPQPGRVAKIRSDFVD